MGLNLIKRVFASFFLIVSYTIKNETEDISLEELEWNKHLLNSVMP